MEINDIWNWLKNNKRICFILLIIVIVLIPSLINILLYIPIPTHETNDSDWLSFWGSFLGGIFGGLATLMGVLLTIFKMNKDKLITDEENKPKVLPVNKNLVVYEKGNIRDNIKNSFSLYNEHKEYTDYYGEDIFLDIINLGKEHAFNILLEFIPPTLEEIKAYLDNNDVDTKDLSNFEEIIKLVNIECIKLSQRWKLQLIKSLDSLQGKIRLSDQLCLLIREYIKILMKNKSKLHYCKGIPLGILKLDYSNIMEKLYYKEYGLYMNTSICKILGDDLYYYPLYIEFIDIEE